MIEAVAQVGNEVDDFDVGVQADDLALPGAKRRQLDGDLVAGDDVGVDRGQRQQGGQVGELPTRVTGRSLVPVVLTSMVVVVAVNAAPQSPGQRPRRALKGLAASRFA